MLCIHLYGCGMILFFRNTSSMAKFSSLVISQRFSGLSAQKYNSKISAPVPNSANRTKGSGRVLTLLFCLAISNKQFFTRVVSEPYATFTLTQPLTRGVGCVRLVILLSMNLELGTVMVIPSGVV